MSLQNKDLQVSTLLRKCQCYCQNHSGEGDKGGFG